MDLRSHIRDIMDFPKKGICFLDITPLLLEPKAFQHAVDALADRFSSTKANKIIAAEARGFIFGAPLAYRLGIGFVPVRKPGKLPHAITSVTYDLEYGTDTLEMHKDAIEQDEPVLVIDDLLATGGTAEGMLKLVEKAGGNVVGIGFLIELGFLNGQNKLNGLVHECLIKV